MKQSHINALIYASVCFNMGLCFVYTRGFPVSELWVILSELCILGLALSFIMLSRRTPDAIVPVMCFVGCNFVALWIFRQEVELKGLRDILGIVLFFLLGVCWGSYQSANRIFVVLSVVVASLGLFEWLFLESFVRVFDVLGYYRARGTVTFEQTQWVESGLFASGMRPQGRGLLSFLGDHRVSSVFLEPVSMGNFAVIVAAWGLAHDDRDWRKIVAFVLVGALFTIAADARFASAAVLMLVLVRFSGIWRYSWLIPALPCIVIAGLIGWAAFEAPVFFDDTFSGRVLLTGSILSTLDIGDWLGLKTGVLTAYDSGYPYAAQTFGVLLVVAAWAAYCLLPAPSPMSGRFKFYLALYITLLLCISGTSLFSIKTAALLWFALGSLCKSPELAALDASRNYMPAPDRSPRLVSPGANSPGVV